ncbi:DUF4880 domain-containing protein [Sphingomonas sp. 2378]|uniref:DUF4880 domain-containing protein n=1 Tax=Sphingomonas sp. 2378 TaxID=1219748 RepID=UPI00311AF282
MTNRAMSAAPPPHVVNEAIGWMMAVREDALTPAERAEFDAWLARDVTHRCAWDRLNGALTPFHSVSTSVSGAALAASIDRQAISRRAALRKGGGAVAASVLALLLADRVTPLVDLFAQYRTSTGQRRRFDLPDGSVLMLDARSAADLVAPGGRRHGLTIDEGIALVDARAAESPFGVAIGGLRAKWREGRAMFVNRAGVRQAIAVDHPLFVDLPGSASRMLAPGRGIQWDGNRFVELASNEVLNSASWVEGKLILHDRPLRALIDAVRPYQMGILSITEQAARIHVSGVFDLDRTEETLEMIASLFPIRIVRFGRFFLRIEPG